MKYKLDRYNVTRVYSTGRWESMPLSPEEFDEGWVDSTDNTYVKGEWPHNNDRNSCRLELVLLYPTLKGL
jgi:hypothetical protein